MLRSTQSRCLRGKYALHFKVNAFHLHQTTGQQLRHSATHSCCCLCIPAGGITKSRGILDHPSLPLAAVIAAAMRCPPQYVCLLQQQLRQPLPLAAISAGLNHPTARRKCGNLPLAAALIYASCLPCLTQISSAATTAAACCTRHACSHCCYYVPHIREATRVCHCGSSCASRCAMPPSSAGSMCISLLSLL